MSGLLISFSFHLIAWTLHSKFNACFLLDQGYLKLQKQPPEEFNKKKPLLKISPWGLQLYCKDTPAQVFSCKYCEIFKTTSFEEHLLAAEIISY